MLLPLLMNLRMFGRVSVDGAIDRRRYTGGRNNEKTRNEIRRKKILNDDDEIYNIVKIFMQCQK